MWESCFVEKGRFISKMFGAFIVLFFGYEIELVLVGNPFRKMWV